MPCLQFNLKQATVKYHTENFRFFRHSKLTIKTPERHQWRLKFTRKQEEKKNEVLCMLF